MPITEPKSERALLKLMEIFTGMTGVRPAGGWTYAHDPVVDRSYLPPGPTQVMPAGKAVRLLVGSGDGSQFARYGPGEDTGADAKRRAYVYRFRANVRGYTLATNLPEEGPVLAETWRERLLDDCLDTLHRNLALGGVARGIDVTADKLVIDGGELAPVAAFLLPITVELVGGYATS